MAATAAPSAPFLSPRPTQRDAASAADSVTRTSSMARLRSGRPEDEGMPQPYWERGGSVPLQPGPGRHGSSVEARARLEPERPRHGQGALRRGRRGPSTSASSSARRWPTPTSPTCGRATRSSCPRSWRPTPTRCSPAWRSCSARSPSPSTTTTPGSSTGSTSGRRATASCSPRRSSRPRCRTAGTARRSSWPPTPRPSVDELLDAIEQGTLVLASGEAAAGAPEGALDTLFSSSDRLARDPDEQVGRDELLDLLPLISPTVPPVRAVDGHVGQGRRRRGRAGRPRRRRGLVGLGHHRRRPGPALARPPVRLVAHRPGRVGPSRSLARRV